MPIKPAVIETNTDLLTANLFTFEIIGLNLVSPNFSHVDGMSRSAEAVTTVDGGSGLTRKFHGGVINYEDITVIRIRDNTPNDKAMSDFVTDYFEFGTKRDGAMIKRHKGAILRRVEFIGLCAGSEQWPSYDNTSAAAEEMSYPMGVDWYGEIF